MAGSIKSPAVLICIWGFLISQLLIAGPIKGQVIILFSGQDKLQVQLAASLTEQFNKNLNSPAPTQVDVIEFRKSGLSLNNLLLKPDNFSNGAKTVSEQQTGMAVKSLSQMPSRFDEAALNKYLTEVSPATIIDLDDEMALALARIRTRNQLKDIKISWVHSNFFQGHLMRITNELDQTFVLGQDLKKSWIGAGAMPAKVKSFTMKAGPATPNVSRDQVLSTMGFDSQVDTVFVNSNTTAITRLSDYVHKLAVGFKTPVQIIVYCNAPKDLKALQSELLDIPAMSKVSVVQSLSSESLTNLINASDLYVSRASTEATTLALNLKKPMLLVEAKTGYEGQNADYLGRTHLAFKNTIINILTDEGRALMHDSESQKQRLMAQAEFNRGVMLEGVARLSMPRNELRLNAQNQNNSSKLNERLAETLGRLETDAPADIELLLSYDSSRVSLIQDPMASLFIRLGSKIYALTNSATPTSIQTIDEFVLSNELPETLSLRISGIPKERLNKLTDSLNTSITQGTALLETLELDLKAVPGRLTTRRLSRWLKSTLTKLQSHPELRVETIYYGRGKTFTVSSKANDLLMRPLRSLESQVGKRIVVNTDEAFVSYENINGNSAGADKENIAKQQVEFNAIKARLIIEQAQLENDQKKILNLKTDSIALSLETALKSFSEAEIALVTNHQEILLTPVKRQILQQLRQEVVTWEQAHAAYETAMDKFTFAQEDLYIRSSNFFMQVMANNLKLHFPEQKIAKLTSVAKEGLADFNEYDRNKGGYGTPHDRFRIDYIHYFFTHFRTFLNTLNKIQNSDNPIKRLVNTTREGMPEFVNGVIAALPVLPGVARLISTIFTASRSEKSQKRFISDFNAAIKAFRKSYGFKVDIIGAEQIPLPSSPADNTVTIFAPTHREGDHDLVTWSAMTSGDFGLDNYLLFGAADNFSPKPVADQLNKVDSFMFIGRGSDKPIDKTIAQLKKTDIRAMMIFPEGGVDAGFFETRPVRTKFTTGLLRRLREEGFKINIVPLTYSRSGSFVYADPVSIPWTHDDDSKRHLEIRVGKPIDTKTIDTLISLGGTDTVNHYIRASWIENMRTDSERLNGQIRVETFEKRFASELNFKFPMGHSCTDLLREIK